MPLDFHLSSKTQRQHLCNKKPKHNATCLNIMEYNPTTLRFMRILSLVLPALGQDNWKLNTWLSKH